PLMRVALLRRERAPLMPNLAPKLPTKKTKIGFAAHNCQVRLLNANTSQVLQIQIPLNPIPLTCRLAVGLMTGATTRLTQLAVTRANVAGLEVDSMWNTKILERTKNVRC